MPIKWAQSRQDQIEVMQWVSGDGPVTPAVKDATMRYGVSFAAAIITRRYSDGFKNN